MKLGAILAGVCCCAALRVLAQPAAVSKPDSPYAVIADQPGLPRVLLIGDSISEGYTLPVRSLLRGQANVHRIPENAGPTTNGLAKLRGWLGAGRWDVVHFNWGLHDLKIMSDGERQVGLPAYAANLRELVRELKATGARLIWATTTPVPSEEAKLKVKRRSADVPLYNAAAATVMAEYRVCVNDLYGLALPQLAAIQYPADVHYHTNGSQVLAQQVATCIAAQLATAVVDARGVVCVEAEHFTVARNWEPAAHYTGTGVVAQVEGPQFCFVEYDLRISQPGRYQVHLLGNRRRNVPVTENVVAVQATGNGIQTQTRLRFHELNAPAWTNLRDSGEPGAAVEFATPGAYKLRLAAERGQGFFVDKLVLASSGYVPTGMGPEETRCADALVAAGGFDPMVVLPPAWAFGVLYGGYTDQAESLATVKRLRDAGFPVDAYWIDSWFWDFAGKGQGPGGYLSFVEDKSAFPDVREMWDEFQRLGVKGGIWMWDCILREGNEAVFDEFHRRKAFSNLGVETGSWHNRTRMTICGNIDFSKPEAVELWREKLAPFFERGLDFLKLDRSSALPFTRAAFEATQTLGRETGGRGFVLAHLHSTHDPRHKLYPTKWSGDAKITWMQPDYPDNSVYAMGGFRENIGMVADPKRSTYAVPFLTHDAGGYDFFGSQDFGDELYVRWLQFSCLNPLMTIFSTHKNASRNHPTSFPPAVQAVAKKYLQLRMRLFPYLYTGALNTRLQGRKLVQGDGLHDDQYLLGDDLLAAPVCVPGATTREVHLPAGNWIEWDTDQLVAGGRPVQAAAPLDRLPLFVREGAIIPLRDYAPSIEAGTSDKLTLEIFPGSQYSVFVLREDDGRSNEYLAGRIAATELRTVRNADGARLEIQPVKGEFAGMTPRREWVARFHRQAPPQAVTVDGQPAAFNYDAGARMVSVHFQADKLNSTTVEVR
jgi:hypothetical protein